MSAGGGSMASFTKVALPAVLASFVPSYLFWDLTRNRKFFGGGVPPSYADPNWGKETERKFDSGWPREAASPIVMNPITRQNFSKV
ncbi:hypothetical protein R1flu_014536 [Riccia fluitans]|uniref:NADH dehydrogenase [ubiquinone] 1 alpha subcomplex subunit 1 n=1 Tax=Riccia fluitans TaxID=41844 RepID=A0ABD1YGR0_9MARC